MLLDILLPKVNGLAVCQALREKGSHVPIILLTAKDQVYILELPHDINRHQSGN